MQPAGGGNRNKSSDLSKDSDMDDLNNKLSIKAETMNSNDMPAEGGENSSMDISLVRSGERHKGKRAKGKKKKFGTREVSESVDNLATASRSKDRGVITVLECVNDLFSTGLIESRDELHLFALWFFWDSNDRIAYSSTQTPKIKFVWIEYYFKHNK